MNSVKSRLHADISRIWLATSLLLIALAIGIFGRDSSLENLVYDYFQRYQYKTASEQILLVGVDSNLNDQKELWSGREFADLAEKLNRLDARLVVATQPLRLPEVPDEKQILALEQLQQQARRVASLDTQVDPLAHQVNAFRRAYDDRQQLEQDLASAGNILLAAHVSDFATENSQASNCASKSINILGADQRLLNSIFRVRHLSTPPAEVCGTAKAIGFSNFWPDTDGTVRRSSLVINADRVFLPSLALAAGMATEGTNNDIVLATSNSLLLNSRPMHTGSKLDVLNRYYAGRPNEPAFNTVTATAVLGDRLEPSAVRNKIVLVGEISPGEMAGLKTPIDDNMSTLIATATSLSNLLRQDYLLRPAWLPTLETGVLLSVVILAMFWIPFMPTIGAILMGLVMAMLILSIQAWFLVSKGIWIQLAAAASFAAISVWSVHMWQLVARRSAEGMSGRFRGRARPSINKQDEYDSEFAILRQQAPTEETKERLYEIAMIHGKAKEFARAEKVLAHIAEFDPNYRDVSDLLKRLSGARKKARTRRKAAANVGGLDRRKLGRYEIDRVLGRGAMATVYLGRDPAINRKVAIKTIALAREFDDKELQDAKLQFRREAESAGRLNHPNIITIYDAGEDDDVSYLAMEYFEGVSLLDHTKPDNLLPAKWVLELAARAAEALDYAHRQNVVHRDIKPANLMYHAATDTLKLTDFGIARLTDSARTKTGIILGTPSYMSPEQLSANGVTGQSDLYSLGVTMYQLVTGNAPFKADSIPKLMDKILNESHAPISTLRIDLPPCVDELVDRAMAKDPVQRFTNGREMALALRDCVRNFG